MPLLILEKYGEEALFSHTKVYQVGTSFVVGDLTMNSRIAMMVVVNKSAYTLTNYWLQN